MPTKTSPTESLTGPPTGIQEMPAHPKKFIFVFCYSDENFYCEKIHFRKVTNLWNLTNVQGCSESISLIFSVLDSGWKKMISRYLPRSPSITFWDGAGMVIVVKHRNGRKKERSNFIGFQCRNSRDNASPRLSRWSAQVKWNYIYLPPRLPHSDVRGVTPFIFASSLHWFLRQRNVVFNITLPSHYDPLFVMTIDDKYDLYTLVFSLHCLCPGLLNQLFAPLHCVDIFRLAHCCPLLPNAQSPDGTSCLVPLLQWRKASPPKHTINFLKDNEKKFKYKNKATTEESKSNKIHNINLSHQLSFPQPIVSKWQPRK